MAAPEQFAKEVLHLGDQVAVLREDVKAYARITTKCAPRNPRLSSAT
jgi:hypothetical protein